LQGGKGRGLAAQKEEKGEKRRGRKDGGGLRKRRGQGRGRKSVESLKEATVTSGRLMERPGT